jgi:fructose-1,6-bisphosphatase/inositol monophosphatase family enzyme
MTTQPSRGGFFENMTVMGGSIATWIAMLWKGEVGCAVLRPSGSTHPWDWCPILGISRKMGFHICKIVESATLVGFDPGDILMEHKQPHELFVVHASKVDELQQWLNWHFPRK